MPKDLFNADSLYSLAGASAIVYIVCNAMQAALNFNPRWLALALSEIVALYGTYLAQSAHVSSDYFIAALNGCLIYCTAVGGAALGHAGQKKGRPKGMVGMDAEPSRRTFFSGWY